MSYRPSCFILAAASLALSMQAQAAETIDVRMDQAKIMDLPPSTLTVIIGNPLIVDVTMLQSSGKMVLTGKGFGETNLLAVDRNGQIVSESTVKVAEQGGNVVVQLGTERETYHCNPRCQPTVALGDGTRHLTDAVQQINARNAAEISSATKPR